MTLLSGILAQAIGLFIFGYTNNIPPSEGYLKWVYFVLLLVARSLLGYGNGCIGACSSSIIAFNFAERMGTLFGIYQLFTQLGMSSGGIFGAYLKEWFGYLWVFNINAILMLILFVAVLIFLPYDTPVV